MRNWSRKFIKESETMNAFASTFGDHGTKYLFMDFDDTVRHSIGLPDGDRKPPTTPEEVSVFPGVGQAIKEWQDAGWQVCGMTNQAGPLRKRSYVPDFMRSQATLEDAAFGAGKVMQQTLVQLGVTFPIFFCSDATVFVLEGGNVHVAQSGFGQENKKDGKASKPNSSMGDCAVAKFGSPDLHNSYMIGDSYQGADEGLAKAMEFEWIHPGRLGKDFIRFTESFFREDGEKPAKVADEAPVLQKSYSSSLGYHNFG